MHIFLDESGQFTQYNHEEYFVIASFTVGDPERTKKEFRKWMRGKFPRKMCGQAEIKWSNSSIDEKLRLKTLKYIASMDVRIFYTYLKKRNIPAEYRRGDKIKDGLLYTNIVGENLEMYLPSSDADFRIFCDQRGLPGMTKGDFKNAIEARMLPDLPNNVLFQLECLDSTTNVNIQISDWIVGALAKYLEGTDEGQIYYNILKNNIIGSGKEVFSNEIEII